MKILGHLPLPVQLDIPIATKVMGWTETLHLKRSSVVVYLVPGTDRTVAGFYPSDNLEHMMRVVERMQALGWTWRATMPPGREPQAQFWQGCSPYAGAFIQHTGRSLMVATCCAALDAIEWRQP